MRYLPVGVVMVVLLFTFGCGRNATEVELAGFIDEHVARVDPLSTTSGLVYWQATTTGDPNAYDQFSKMQLEIRRVYNNPADFALLERIKDSGQVRDERLLRQLDKLYYGYLPNQIEGDLLKRIVDLDTKIQADYGGFRAKVAGAEVTMSDIYTIMTTETDVRRRELTYRASKQVGNAIVGDLIELVKLRNAAARKVGFDNFHGMTITAGEQSVAELDALFAQLDKLTSGPFAEMKGELDGILAKTYGVAVGDLMPWHYHDPFFQRTPLVYEFDLDAYYAGKDVKALSERFYAGVGLPVDDILGRSDLYDKKDKYPHAYSQDVDRKGDVRILCNLQDTERWMETILHELGHAVYSKYHDSSEPWLLREPAHNFTTEAIAMFFGRLSRNAAWMQEMLELSDEQREEIEDVSFKYLQFQQILFARWAMVMYNFEKALYADPDQDLDKLWWDMVEKYQFVKRPPAATDGGWASKLHFVVAPCYYHNYMMGELLASQLHNHIVSDVLKLESDEGLSYAGDERVGDYLRDKVLAPGARYQWNDMIERATGERLTPRYFVEQFVR